MLDHLPLLNGIVQETLRLHPSVYMFGRVAIRDTTLGERYIPKGTTIRVSSWAMGRAKEFWGNNAEEFRYVCSLLVSYATSPRTMHIAQVLLTYHCKTGRCTEICKVFIRIL